MIRKILVANRAEIASRVFRTAADMGLSTVAVYSDPDRDAPFVSDADEAVPLGGSTPAESYLRADAIIAAAELTGADAIHPGYGFLSENAEFAQSCADAGIRFIGPSPDAITKMGSKIAARELMERSGVPVLPGKDLTGTDADTAASYADEIGWPVLVKASFGGGGRGMRVVRDRGELAEAIESARREAGSAFGNDTVFLEHYVDEPRHVEMQIFGDEAGTVVHLNERECSIQRRHQKILEESPSPAVDEELRAAMGDAAVKAGKALSYVGAGTVEFLLAPDGSFYFLEVNTRLQVEHPVTELVTGLDLVRLQIDVADGRPLPSDLSNPSISGWAIEARLYAEDVEQGFLPAAGTLDEFDVPMLPGVRLDSGVVAGSVVSTNYDPMLAKVIAHGATRAEALARLAKTLRQTKVAGVTTNRTLLVGVLEDQDFASGRMDTHFLDRVSISDLQAVGDIGDANCFALAAALADQALNRSRARSLTSVPTGFRNSPVGLQERTLLRGETEHRVEYRLNRAPLFRVDGEELDVTVENATAEAVALIVDGVRRSFTISSVNETVIVSEPRGSVTFARAPRFPDASDQIDPGSLVAPMPGTVVRLNVSVGDVVAEGDTLVVLEAMKMEHSVKAATGGTVTEVPIAAGSPVDNGQTLVVLAGDTEETSAEDAAEGKE